MSNGLIHKQQQEISKLKAEIEKLKKDLKWYSEYKVKLEELIFNGNPASDAIRESTNSANKVAEIIMDDFDMERQQNSRYDDLYDGYLESEVEG